MRSCHLEQGGLVKKVLTPLWAALMQGVSGSREDGVGSEGFVLPQKPFPQLRRRKCEYRRTKRMAYPPLFGVVLMEVRTSVSTAQGSQESVEG